MGISTDASVAFLADDEGTFDEGCAGVVDAVEDGLVAISDAILSPGSVTGSLLYL